jgi:hypothetical protein
LFQIDQSLFYSPLHGYFFSQLSENGIWLWDVELGWWLSSPAYYPYAYRAATDSWIFFRLSPAQPRSYFDFTEAKWMP